MRKMRLGWIPDHRSEGRMHETRPTTVWETLVAGGGDEEAQDSPGVYQTVEGGTRGGSRVVGPARSGFFSVRAGGGRFAKVDSEGSCQSRGEEQPRPSP